MDESWKPWAVFAVDYDGECSVEIFNTLEEADRTAANTYSQWESVYVVQVYSRRVGL